jgi:hypothetical protein
MFYYYHWVDTSAGGLLVPEGIIRPVVSASALSWFNRYMCYWNLQFLNNESIIKTKVLLPQAYVTVADIGDPIYALLLARKTFNIIWLFNFSILSVPDEGYSRNALCALNFISTFY